VLVPSIAHVVDLHVQKLALLQEALQVSLGRTILGAVKMADVEGDAKVVLLRQTDLIPQATVVVDCFNQMAGLWLEGDAKAKLARAPTGLGHTVREPLPGCCAVDVRAERSGAEDQER
jgi:hypothetical protein